MSRAHSFVFWSLAKYCQIRRIRRIRCSVGTLVSSSFACFLVFGKISSYSPNSPYSPLCWYPCLELIRQESAINAKSENSKNSSCTSTILRLYDFSDSPTSVSRLYDSCNFTTPVQRISDYTIFPILRLLFNESLILPIVRFFLFSDFCFTILRFYDSSDFSDFVLRFSDNPSLLLLVFLFTTLLESISCRLE